ncbi:UNVERIFIED_CONTAM: hypothetical protein K2H54_028382 [Gekko kuhli]
MERGAYLLGEKAYFRLLWFILNLGLLHSQTEKFPALIEQAVGKPILWSPEMAFACLQIKKPKLYLQEGAVFFNGGGGDICLLLLVVVGLFFLKKELYIFIVWEIFLIFLFIFIILVGSVNSISQKKKG